MRIISGKYRGKKLISPKNDDIRPTTDKAKESLFNIIQSYIYDSKFLDLFSGSGAISLEAFSRGASDVTLVEKNKSSIDIIKSNIKLIAENTNIKLEQLDVTSFLKKTNKKYDIIFADPPYNYDKINEMIDIIAQKNILLDNGVLIIETDKLFELKIPKNMVLEKEKVYSISKFSIIKYLN